MPRGKHYPLYQCTDCNAEQYHRDWTERRYLRCVSCRKIGTLVLAQRVAALSAPPAVAEERVQKLEAIAREIVYFNPWHIWPEGETPRDVCIFCDAYRIDGHSNDCLWKKAVALTGYDAAVTPYPVTGAKEVEAHAKASD